MGRNLSQSSAYENKELRNAWNSVGAEGDLDASNLKQWRWLISRVLIDLREGWGDASWWERRDKWWLSFEFNLSSSYTSPLFRVLILVSISVLSLSLVSLRFRGDKDFEVLAPLLITGDLF